MIQYFGSSSFPAHVPEQSVLIFLRRRLNNPSLTMSSIVLFRFYKHIIRYSVDFAKTAPYGIQAPPPTVTNQRRIEYPRVQNGEEFVFALRVPVEERQRCVLWHPLAFKAKHYSETTIEATRVYDEGRDEDDEPQPHDHVLFRFDTDMPVGAFYERLAFHTHTQQDCLVAFGVKKDKNNNKIEVFMHPQTNRNNSTYDFIKLWARATSKVLFKVLPEPFLEWVTKEFFKMDYYNRWGEKLGNYVVSVPKNHPDCASAVNSLREAVRKNPPLLVPARRFVGKDEKAKTDSDKKNPKEKDEFAVPPVADYSAVPIRFAYYSPYVWKSYFSAHNEMRMTIKLNKEVDEMRFEEIPPEQVSYNEKKEKVLPVFFVREAVQNGDCRGYLSQCTTVLLEKNDTCEALEQKIIKQFLPYHFTKEVIKLIKVFIQCSNDRHFLPSVVDKSLHNAKGPALVEQVVGLAVVIPRPIKFADVAQFLPPTPTPVRKARQAEVGIKIQT